MAFELKRKDVVKECGYKLCASYCSMQFLLRYQDRIGYTHGVYGWNCDVYRIGDVVLTTGYRGMVGSPINYDLLRDYELKAEQICCDYSISYEDQRDKVNALLYELLDKAKEDYQ